MRVTQAARLPTSPHGNRKRLERRRNSHRGEVEATGLTRDERLCVLVSQAPHRLAGV